MLNQCSLEQFQELAKTSKRIALAHEILADQLTPISVFTALQRDMAFPTLLESGEKRTDTGRYSFLGFDPIAELIVKNKEVNARMGMKVEPVPQDPLVALREMLQRFHCVSTQPHLGFIGGAVGFISYDAVRLFEELPDRHPDVYQIPDLLFSFYRTSIIFDHQTEKLMLIKAVEVTDDLPKLYTETEQQLQLLVNKIKQPTHASDDAAVGLTSEQSSALTIDIPDAEFREKVEQAKKYIIKGDAFQIVISRRFQQKYTVSPFSVYRALRRTSPAPYMFYLDRGEYVIAGASPEKLVSVQDRLVTINPIAGTRRRGNAEQDEKLAAELLSSEKDNAEHIMLVDLARNDIGSVCKPGSVKIQELAQVKKYSHVMHLISVITGQMADHFDALDALRAVIPAGTLSGAPKIRAMEIIDELETSRRGLYGGAICSIDNEGNLDSCIAIRMAVLRDGVATVRAGAGIVYDSDPQAEADETLHKAQTVLDALAFAERRLT